ncbi:PTS transporter subunit EIIC [Carnobacterium gallinarum]|uniref:PTS transporter subunit EIIC n=1 Tax=Carnobacterium gallinarum TaxID=2749 RepID=UPI00055628FB|nr:PTS transporter subunit EIIC [Carnobacterium gallinarum]
MKEKNKLVLAFEQFGRVLLLPVSILPGAGIILGIGAAFTNPNTLNLYPFLNNSVFQFIMNLFVTLGNVVFGNLPVIFAIGVAVGLAKSEKGSAALSGFVGFIVLHKVLNFLLIQAGTLVVTDGMDGGDAKFALAKSMQTSVLGIQTIDLNVFGGIITGLVIFWVHKKTLKIRVPEVLGFFSGPRLVPIMSILVMTVVAGILFIVWPFVQMGISTLSMMIIKSGYGGTFLYGILERALLPFGLHHGLNLPVMTTDLGGVWTIDGQQVGGTINAYMASLTSPDITTIDPSITRFNAGKFVYFMFGLPAAAYAMYKTAKPEKRKAVASLLFAAALTSFVTGITEPIEFTFLFAAPMLYAAHAVMAGLILMITQMVGAAVMAPMGHGLINFTIYGVIQGFKTHWYMIPIVGIFCGIMYYSVFKFMILKFNLKTPGREDGDEEVKLATKDEVRNKYNINQEDKKAKKSETDAALDAQALALIECHGGQENIVDVDACITRLRITVKDKDLVQGERIKSELGAKGFVESNMQMQSIYGGHANVLKNRIIELVEEGI